MHLRKRQILASCALLIILLLYRSLDPQQFIQATQPATANIAQLTVAPIPIKKQVAVDPVLNATAVMVTDENSGAILFSKNADTYYAPASTTKLMTALVARRLYKPGAVLTVKLSAPVGGTLVGLHQGEQYTLEDLLAAALISSGNDAAEVLAEHHPNGVEAFVSEMNTVAAELNLKNTHFSNPAGFDDDDHYSTARDLSILAREVLKDGSLKKIVATKESTIRDITGQRKLFLKNTNQLLGADSRVTGMKTGTTLEAGEVLVTSVEDGEHTMLFVVLGSNSRYTDTQTLLNWIDTTISWHLPEELLAQ